MYLTRKSVFVIFLIALACGNPKRRAGWIDERRILNADQEPGNWMSLGGNFRQQHYSPLDKINEQNVDQLGLAWEYDASSRRGRIQHGLEATPIVVDGVLYTSGSWGVVYALDAKTGTELWRFDPEVDGSYARRACCDMVNRGVQVWKGKVYVGVLDGYLVCLDAATGKIVWRVDTITDRTRFYTITSPPQVAGKVVVIGNSGGEFGVRGYVTAYDLETGKQAWRFFIVPGDPAKGFEHEELRLAAKTWDPKSDWAAGLGGTAWGEFTYDPELNLLYVGTGNSSPYPIWFRSPSGGDNLFLASVVALNPDNGKMAWYYQTTPGEIWDYTCSSTMTLAELSINGEQRKVLMTAPKNGFYYVLDRVNGKFISAKNFVPVNWASHIDSLGRPVLTGNANYEKEPKLVYPGPAGGHNWQPMSFSPVTGLAYIPALHMPFEYTSVEDFKYNRDDNTGTYLRPASTMSKYQNDSALKEQGFLIAWDPVLQKERWRKKMTVANFNGGVLSTGSNLLVQGTTDGYFVVYRASDGAELKRIETGTGIMAAPMTYEIDGEQFVTVMAGFGGAELWYPPEHAAIRKYVNSGRILTFKIGGSSTPLPPLKEDIAVPSPPEMNFTVDQIEKGGILYGKYCNVCHGGFGKEHQSAYPDLSKLASETHAKFRQILLGGSLSAYGMASFSDVFTDKEADELHAFLLSMQKKMYEEATKPQGKP